MPTAFVLMRCDEKDELEIKRSLHEMGVTVVVRSTIGHYDIVAKITSPNLEHLNEALEDIHGNNKIRSSKVLLGVKQAAEAA